MKSVNWRNLWKASLALLSALLLARGEPKQQGGRLYGACEVIENLGTLSGKTITIEGLLNSSEEIFSLGGRDCAKPLRTGSYSWATCINLKFIQGHADGVKIPGGVVSPDRSGKYYRAVFTGVLETRKKYQIRDAPGGRFGNGFGHLSMCPAQLVVIRVDSITPPD